MPKRKDLALFFDAFARIARGETLRPELVALIRKLGGTPNKEFMRVAIGVCQEVDMDFHRESLAGLERILSEAEQLGPSPKEVLCPDPHEGMYLLGESAVAWAGTGFGASLQLRRLGDLAAKITGQRLRLYDLVADPSGDVRGLPGMRANNGPARYSAHLAWSEIRDRQPRGMGGQPKALASLCPLKALDHGNAITFGAAWIWRAVLGSPEGDRLLAGPLSPGAPLPARLRLSLSIWRWNGGTLAVLGDPGEEGRGRFVTKGSAEAGRDPDRAEDPTTWVLALWDKPMRPRVTFGLRWRTAPPEPPLGADFAFIPGADDAVQAPLPPVAPVEAPETNEAPAPAEPREPREPSWLRALRDFFG